MGSVYSVHFIGEISGDAGGLQARDFGGQVVAHQVEMVRAAFAGMHGDFRRGQRQDEPSMAGVHCFEVHHVAEEGAVGVRVCAF